jgi:lysophospholipase L1-like esterase
MELSLLKGDESVDLSTAWTRVAKQLAELQSMAASSGFSVAVVVLPPREQVKGAYANTRYQSRARAIADDLGFLTIDPLPAMAARTDVDALYIPYDRNHPSAAGHRIIAQTIFDHLEQRGALEPLARHLAAIEAVH